MTIADPAVAGSPEVEPQLGPISVGDLVKFDLAYLQVDRQPNDKTIAFLNANSPMLVTAIDPATLMITCTRDGKPAGVFFKRALVTVPAPPVNAAPPLVPDQLPLCSLIRWR